MPAQSLLIWLSTELSWPRWLFLLSLKPQHGLDSSIALRNSGTRYWKGKSSPGSVTVTLAIATIKWCFDTATLTSHCWS